MAGTVTASQMTDGQIDNLAQKLRDACRKHRDEITTEAAQQALGSDNLGMKMFAVFREQVEAFSEMIVREVEVAYDVSPHETISATKRVEYLNGEVVAIMPRNGTGKKRVKVYFFPLRRVRGAEEVQKLIDEHGLKPDGYAVSAVNAADPTFADSHPNCTQWEDENGNHCYVTFLEWHGSRKVLCNRSQNVWAYHWWVGGVRK